MGWVELIILLIAVAISYAMRPKTSAPAPASGDAPSTEDGQVVKHHFGTCWVEDQFILAWKVVSHTPIKS